MLHGGVADEAGGAGDQDFLEGHAAIIAQTETVYALHHPPGGHFLKGIVRPTLEVTIVETPARLRRRKRPELGIALIDLSKSC
jgi:predicted DNA-binding protein with PD1-like motif